MLTYLENLLVEKFGGPFVNDIIAKIGAWAQGHGVNAAKVTAFITAGIALVEEIIPLLEAKKAQPAS